MINWVFHAKLYSINYKIGITDGSKPAILQYSNYDIQNIITPVNWRALERILHECDYDKDKTEFLISGFKTGFSIEYHGPTNVKLEAPNF